MCKGQVINTQYKGNITLLDTEVGSRRAVLCPFASSFPVYATADCLVCNWSARWSPLNFNFCPDPPFSVAAQVLFDYVKGVRVHGNVVH